MRLVSFQNLFFEASSAVGTSEPGVHLHFLKFDDFFVRFREALRNDGVLRAELRSKLERFDFPLGHLWTQGLLGNGLGLDLRLIGVDVDVVFVADRLDPHPGRIELFSTVEENFRANFSVLFERCPDERAPAADVAGDERLRLAGLNDIVGRPRGFEQRRFVGFEEFGAETLGLGLRPALEDELSFHVLKLRGSWASSSSPSLRLRSL